MNPNPIMETKACGAWFLDRLLALTVNTLPGALPGLTVCVVTLALAAPLRADADPPKPGSAHPATEGAPTESRRDPLAPSDAATPQEDHPVEDATRFKLQTKADKSLPTLYLVGDSTMKVGTPGQRGWGEELAPYFDLHKINIVNEAIGGRSSRTFQTEGRWAAVVAMLQKGDYVIIQFGHNDGGAINDNFRARASIKGTGEATQEIDNMLTHKHESVHSFGWYMRKYATDAKAKGAIPIILSLVPRNSWKDGKVVRATPNSYGQWARDAAEATGTVFVDHNEIIAQSLEKLGPDKALPLFADGRLHASPDGAKFNARMAVAGLKGMPGNPLAGFLSAAANDIAPFQGGK